MVLAAAADLAEAVDQVVPVDQAALVLEGLETPVQVDQETLDQADQEILVQVEAAALVDLEIPVQVVAVALVGLEILVQVVVVALEILVQGLVLVDLVILDLESSMVIKHLPQ